MNALSSHQILETVFSLAKREGIELYLVGGWVRDQLLEINTSFGNSSIDFDFCSPSPIDKFAELVASTLQLACQINPVYLTANLTGVVEELSVKLDFARYRDEAYSDIASLPVISIGDQSTDYHRRDFTVNTLKVSLTDLITNQDWKSKLIASKLAEQDLENRVIRTLHSSSFLDDPNRIFRAYRYKHRIRGELAVETKKEIEAAVLKVFNYLPAYRIAKELKLVFQEKDPYPILLDLIDAGVFSEILGKEIIATIEYQEAVDKLQIVEGDNNLIMYFQMLCKQYDISDEFYKYGFNKTTNRLITLTK